jgi:CheY-like chemotaxis protein
MPTLLIADDSMFQRFKHGKVAKDLGFTVLEAKDGRECLETVRKKPVDGILLDLTMPSLDGFEVLKTLKKESIRTPVIVTTADVQAETKQEVLRLGAVEVLYKPVDDEALKQKLKGILGRRAR